MNTDKQKRIDYKRDHLLSWLGHWTVTTLPIWCEVSGFDINNESRFLKSMLNMQFIKDFKVNYLPHRFLLLTPKGKSRAMILTEYAERATTSKSKIPLKQIFHYLLIQRAVGEYHDMTKSFIPARYISNKMEVIPDAIIDRGGKKTALEVETTGKSKSRLYWIFRKYLSLIDKDKFDKEIDKVLYVFDDPKIYALYLRLFSEKEWPLIIRDAKNNKFHHKKEDGKPVMFSVEDLKKHVDFRLLD